MYQVLTFAGVSIVASIITSGIFLAFSKGMFPEEGKIIDMLSCALGLSIGSLIAWLLIVWAFLGIQAVLSCVISF